MPTRSWPCRLALLLLLAWSCHAGAVTLRYASIDDPQTLDPHAANLLPTSRVVTQIYDTLVFRDRDWKLTPWLATGWKAVDARTWRFTLRKGVRFHDGTPFTADDVVFSAERIQSPTSQLKSTLTSVARVVKVDDHTVDMVMSEPNPVLPEQLFQFRIMSRAWAKKHNAERPQNYTDKEETFAARNTNGTGPFMLKSRQTDVRTVLVRNPDWWGIAAGLWDSNLDEVVLLPIRSNATRLAALVSGEVDMVVDPAPADVARLKTQAGIKVLEGPEIRVHLVIPDLHRDQLVYGSVKDRNPFKDLRVRQAMAHAIDIDGIIAKVMRGLGKPAGLMITKQMAGYPADLDRRLPFDRERAKKLLAEAGYPNGFAVTMDCGNNTPAPEICTAVAGMLSAVGIEVKPNIMALPNFYPKVESHDTSLFLISWGGGATNDAYASLQLLLRSKGANGDGDFNMGRYSNPRLDALIDRIRVEGDTARRDALVRDAFAIISTDLPHLTLHQPVLPWVMRAGVSTWHTPINTVYFFRTRIQ